MYNFLNNKTMKANNYDKIAERIQDAQLKGYKVERMWDSVNSDYDTCMKAERAFLREVKAIANVLDFTVDWGDFKSVSSALRILDQLHEYVECMIAVIKRVYNEVDVYKPYRGAAFLKKTK